MAFGAMRWAMVRVSGAGVRGGVIAHEDGAGFAGRGRGDRRSHWPPFGPLVSGIDGSTARRYDRYVVVTIVPGRVG